MTHHFLGVRPARALLFEHADLDTIFPFLEPHALGFSFIARCDAEGGITYS